MSSKKEGFDADSEDSNSVSSKLEDDKQPRMRWSDISFTTNESSSTPSTVVSTSVARHPTARSGLPTFAAAAAAAAPTVPLKEKKPRRDGFREQFLQKLRVMLDRESQNDSTTVQWSTDGDSFIVTDKTQFEEQTIPTYFCNQIVFASFLRKLQRWGFKNRRTSRRDKRYEFCSPTFKRIGDKEALTAAAVNETGNDGRDASITNPATTSDFPSSALATVVSTVAAMHPTAQSGLPTFAAVAAAADPPVPLSEKKPRRAGFNDEFLHKLRVMLDRESQNDRASVQWSIDGNSFIIMDQNQYEDTIPTYFDEPIIFASFLRKLQRWGFNQVSRKQAGCYEFCSPTFKRLDAESPSADAAAFDSILNIDFANYSW